MIAVEIPTRGDIANYIQTTTLGGKTFILEFMYNDRDSSWYLSIKDISGTTIRSGIKLVPNFSLLRNLVSDSWNIGRVILFDSRVNPKPPILSDLGTASSFLYVEDGILVSSVISSGPSVPIGQIFKGDTGPIGPEGPIGKRGADGADGAAGAPGVSGLMFYSRITTGSVITSRAVVPFGNAVIPFADGDLVLSIVYTLKTPGNRLLVRGSINGYSAGEANVWAWISVDSGNSDAVKGYTAHSIAASELSPAKLYSPDSNSHTYQLMFGADSVNGNIFRTNFDPVNNARIFGGSNECSLELWELTP